ncbi:hypothetical protein [Methylobrevis albus]|uniref:Uncharacterized protein n=1 Tax=Methylobrevis albus TaxID=2793297 RepID=A0A931I401_9HYPH|nr:hypothetical protein [Methylobrevis albus]MBH0238878.1 hypothetical protein [Methylobrevis albus]
MTVFPFWPTEIKFPGSDYNRQTIAPLTNWASPTINYTSYQGDPRIEERVVADVASFGRQLGIISEAVLELADGDTSGKAVDRLREIVARIDTIKQQNSRVLEERAEEAFAAFLRADPAAAAELLEMMQQKLKDAAKPEV